MLRPELPQLALWIDPTLVALLEQRRREKKEWHRHRKLGTLQTLWLMLAVSMDTQRSSLHEILSLATAQLNIQWSISVAAFCKARAHFSPRRSDLVAWCLGGEASGSLQGRSQPLAWPAPIGCR
jgi:hypothetical protein